METFAFLIHPLNKSDVVRKYPFARFLPEWVVGKIIEHIPPKVVSHIAGIRSAIGEAEGWFVGLPLFPWQFNKLHQEYVYQKIVDCAKIAQDLGARILGLGAFSSVVGDGGITVAEMIKEQGYSIAVTTGNSYTVATAVEGTLEAAGLIGIDLQKAQVAVIGATGSIGRACSILLVEQNLAHLVLVGRDEQRLVKVEQEILRRNGQTELSYSTDIESSVENADIVITVTSATGTLMNPDWLKLGSVVCDVARPRNISRKVVDKRSDILVIEGGVIAVPGNVDFGFNFGFPPRTAFACMAETMILALEGRYKNFTLGKELDPDKVKEIQQLAKRHGFAIAGLRCFEKEISQEQIEVVRKHRRRRK